MRSFYLNSRHNAVTSSRVRTTLRQTSAPIMRRSLRLPDCCAFNSPVLFCRYARIKSPNLENEKLWFDTKSYADPLNPCVIVSDACLAGPVPR